MLEKDDLAAADARLLLEKLLREYEKLLKASRQLIKISDRKGTELNRAKHKLMELTASLEYQATHDALTGILNKGAITRIAEEQLTQRDFVIVLFDIDHFKKVNDSYGHAVGDRVLTLVASLVEKNIRRKDQIGRFGGEEFLILLNDSPFRTCMDLVENLRSSIEHSVLDADEIEVKVTVSMGIALCHRGEPFKDVYARVDKLLYAAKRGGRNRIVTDETGNP